MKFKVERWADGKHWQPSSTRDEHVIDLGNFGPLDRMILDHPIEVPIWASYSALAAITLGGFDSPLGAVVGGMVVGILTSVLPQYLPIFEKMRLAPAFILILAVLLFRPQGLFGRKQVERV